MAAGARLTRPGAWLAALLATAAALVVCVPGLGWGLPSERRLDLLLPDREVRPAIFAALSRPLSEPDGGAERDPTAGCVGPIDPLDAGADGVWLRSELVTYLMSSDDPDEMETLSSLAKVFREPARLDARAFLYGHVYLAAVAAAEGVGWSMGLLPGIPTRAALLEDPALLRRVYLLGRSVSVIAVALTAGLLAAVLWRIGIGVAGVAAGVLVALGPLALSAAHVAKPHALAALFGLAAVVGAFPAARAMRPVVWALQAAAVAAAASASPPHALLAAAAPLALLLRRPRVPPRTWAVCAAAWIGTGIATVVLLNPLALLHVDLFRREAQHHLAGAGWGYGHFGVAKLAGFLGALAARDLAFAAIPLLLLGAAACFRHPEPVRTYLLAMAGLVLVVFGGFLGVTRIALLCLPLLALLAGIGADALARPRRGPARAAGTLCAAVLIAGLAAQSAAAAQSFVRPDPGEEAGAWINASLPAGRCLVLRSDRPLATFMPRFAIGRFPVRRIPLDVPGPPAHSPGETLLVSAVDPERDPVSAWSRPGGAYGVVARFPESGRRPGGLPFPGGPRRPRTILVLEPAAARAGAGAAGD